jgi:uncharacterized protein with von Willebrand factor type A (vWA) domain
MARRATYSRWDGTQLVPDLDADALLRVMGDELIEHGDPEAALRRMLQQGLEVDGQRLQGLREILERLSEARRERLEHDDLGGVFAEVDEALREVIQTERAALDGSDDPSLDSRHRAARDDLDLLEHENLAGRVRGLQAHEFVSDEARRLFEELLETLRDRLTQQFVDQVTDVVGKTTPEDRARLTEMLAELNALLDARRRGVDPVDEARAFAGFMERFGDFFPEAPRTLDELLEVMARRMAAMAQVMNSMSSEQQAQLRELSDQLLEDPDLGLDLQWQVSQLGDALRDLFPRMGWEEAREFTGDQPIGMDEAMATMGELADLDRLEQMLRGATSPGALAEVDIDRVRDLLDDEAADSLDQLADLTGLLTDAGLVERTEGRLQLTPRAIRRLGQNALGDLYRRLSRDRVGRHDQSHDGVGHEREYTTRPWEYGDPFDLDIEATVRNAVARNGPGIPVSLGVDDFSIERTETEVQAATVLMLDLSLSMPMRGNFLPAKKTAMALHQLMASQYPRDYLGVVTFSEMAREIRPERLPEVSWDYVYGTNMQHGFSLARRMLAGQPGNRQIIMVTDGEPTAHLTDDGRPLFSYPPTAETVDRTLREVRRCTRDDIRINVFMLDATPHLARFIEQVTRLNGGRAFLTDNRELGDYVLVDFVEQRRTVRSRR